MKKRVIRHTHKQKESKRYVLVNNPTFLRKEILTNALDVLKLIKDEDNYKNLKIQRTNIENNLKVLVDEIHDSFLYIHRKLPMDDLLKSELFKKTEILHRNIEIPVIKEIHKGLTDEDKISDELRQVESRLRRMNI